MTARTYKTPEAARMAAARSLRKGLRTQPSFAVVQVQPGFDDLAEIDAREALRPYLEDENYSAADKE